jgi:Zn-dependent oligopeptidase
MPPHHALTHTLRLLPTNLDNIVVLPVLVSSDLLHLLVLNRAHHILPYNSARRRNSSLTLTANRNPLRKAYRTQLNPFKIEVSKSLTILPMHYRLRHHYINIRRKYIHAKYRLARKVEKQAQKVKKFLTEVTKREPKK